MISIHAAREGGDATFSAMLLEFRISIHAAREGGDEGGLQDLVWTIISIHAAREGGDLLYRHPLKYDQRFQSTPPVKAATSKNDKLPSSAQISIHAAREGGDYIRHKGVKHFIDFNPRRP